MTQQGYCCPGPCPVRKCLCNQGWYNEVEVVMEEKLQEYLMGGKIQISDIARAMQEELER